jgi:lysophospholipase L1-like esterase
MKNKKTLLLLSLAGIVILFIGFYLFALIKRNYLINNYFKEGRWLELKAEFNKIKKKKPSSLLFGDSMTENFKIYLEESDSLVNMGISGDFSEGLIKRIDNVINYQPNSIFIMIGINDLVEKVPVSEIENNYVKIVELIEKNCPNTKIVIQSTLPTCWLKSTLSSSQDVNKRVQKLNNFLKTYSKNKHITFIDMYSDFVNSNNELQNNLTTDGVHLNKTGYNIWLSYIKDYLYKF